MWHFPKTNIYCRMFCRISKRASTLSQEFITREANSLSPVHFGKSYICVWHIGHPHEHWIHSVNKSKLAQWHKFKRSPDSQKTHTHTYKILVTLWIFWLSRLLYCSSLSPMATPHLEIVSWECSLEQGDSSTLMTWLGLEAVDGWKSRNIFLRRFRGWGDFNAVYRTLYNKGSKFWRTNWCSLGVLYIHLQAFVLLAKNDLSRNII